MSTLEIGAQIAGAFNEYQRNSPRTLQAKAGKLGISDVGDCREYARLRTIETPESDERTYFAAGIGTAIHAEVTKAVVAKFGEDVLADIEVEVKYPNQASVIGHPDLVFPKANNVTDLKTVNGLNKIRVSGPSTRQWWQVMGYAKGLIDLGVLTDDCTASLVFIDRSGKETEFVTFTKTYDPAMLTEASFWLDDVIYAVQHGEQAAKDKPYDFCENWCEFFTICRAGDQQPEGLILDEAVVEAADLYLEGTRLEKQGKAMKDEARADLEGRSGSTGRAVVRWTEVGETEIPGYTRRSYQKLNVKPLKGVT